MYDKVEKKWKTCFIDKVEYSEIVAPLLQKNKDSSRYLIQCLHLPLDNEPLMLESNLDDDTFPFTGELKERFWDCLAEAFIFSAQQNTYCKDLREALARFVSKLSEDEKAQFRNFYEKNVLFLEHQKNLANEKKAVEDGGSIDQDEPIVKFYLKSFLGGLFYA